MWLLPNTWMNISNWSNVCCSLPGIQVELLDDVTYLFKAMNIWMMDCSSIGNDQECSSFKEYDFICTANPTKVVEIGLQCSDIRYQTMNNVCPCLKWYMNSHRNDPFKLYLPHKVSHPKSMSEKLQFESVLILLAIPSCDLKRPAIMTMN